MPTDHSLLIRYSVARRLTDSLFEKVPAEALYDRPIPQRNRIVFYIGHLEAFELNLLAPLVGQRKACDGPLDRLFAFGIDPSDDRLPTDAPHIWPRPDEVQGYRLDVRRKLDKILADVLAVDGDALSVHEEGIGSMLLNVAIEHRLMHAETLAYMFNRMLLNKLPRAVDERTGGVVDDAMVRIPAGTATLGLDRSRCDGFGWDNERDACRVEVPAFEIDRYMVTNAQFMLFIDAGGYDEPRYWTSDDWRWRSRAQLTCPVSWQRVGGKWYLNSLLDIVPFQGDWPVYVSHAEARAYAVWRGKKLPGEAQWQRAAYGTPGAGERAYPWGDVTPTARHGNFNFQSWDPEPVNAHPQGESAFGVAGLLGNGWEWTSTVFAPFPGFIPFPFYPGYSADFFDGNHFVLKGGSPHTATTFLRRSFRNWFQPHYPYAFAGFRCVRI